eukprot:4761277-Pleurochrysis_carterae.AAC.2
MRGRFEGIHKKQFRLSRRHRSRTYCPSNHSLSTSSISPVGIILAVSPCLFHLLGLFTGLTTSSKLSTLR